MYVLYTLKFINNLFYRKNYYVLNSLSKKMLKLKKYYDCFLFQKRLCHRIKAFTAMTYVYER